MRSAGVPSMPILEKAGRFAAIALAVLFISLTSGSGAAGKKGAVLSTRPMS
jgi:hypothetical protein